MCSNEELRQEIRSLGERMDGRFDRLDNRVGNLEEWTRIPDEGDWPEGKDIGDLMREEMLAALQDFLASLGTPFRWLGNRIQRLVFWIIGALILYQPVAELLKAVIRIGKDFSLW